MGTLSWGAHPSVLLSRGPGGGSGVQDGQSSRLCQILNGPPAHLASVLLVGSLLPILLLCAETMGERAEGTMNSKSPTQLHLHPCVCASDYTYLWRVYSGNYLFKARGWSFLRNGCSSPSRYGSRSFRAFQLLSLPYSVGACCMILSLNRATASTVSAGGEDVSVTLRRSWSIKSTCRCAGTRIRQSASGHSSVSTLPTMRSTCAIHHRVAWWHMYHTLSMALDMSSFDPLCCPSGRATSSDSESLDSMSSSGRNMDGHSVTKCPASPHTRHRVGSSSFISPVSAFGGAPLGSSRGLISLSRRNRNVLFFVGFVNMSAVLSLVT